MFETETQAVSKCIIRWDGLEMIIMTYTQENTEAQVDEGPQLGFEDQLEEDGGVGEEAEASQDQEEDGHGEVGAVLYTLDYYY